MDYFLINFTCDIAYIPIKLTITVCPTGSTLQDISRPIMATGNMLVSFDYSIETA